MTEAINFVEYIAGAGDDEIKSVAEMRAESIRKAREDAAEALYAAANFDSRNWVDLTIDVPALALAWLVFASRAQ